MVRGSKKQVLEQFFKNGVKRKGGQLLRRTTKYTEHDYLNDDDDGEVDDDVDHIRWSAITKVL